MVSAAKVGIIHETAKEKGKNYSFGLTATRGLPKVTGSDSSW